MDILPFLPVVKNFPKPGIDFRDLSPLLANVPLREHVAETIAQEWRGKVDAVVMLEARGFIIGTLVGSLLNVPLIMLRKKGKIPGETESYTYALEYGEDTIEVPRGACRAYPRILVVDDILATGGTAHAACALVEKAGGTVVGCAFVLELCGLGGREKLSSRTLHAVVSV